MPVVAPAPSLPASRPLERVRIPDRPVTHSPAPVPHSHVVVFEHDSKSCSQALTAILSTLPREGMSLRGILHILGERGLLMACIIFSLPSLLPIPIPGMSIPQGLVIGLIGLGVLFSRSPFLPDIFLEYRLGYGNLKMVLEQGVRLFSRIEKLSYPRLGFLTGTTFARICYLETDPPWSGNVGKGFR